MFLRMTPVVLPPMASKQVRAFIFSAKSLSSCSKFSLEELRIYLAPSFFKISTCSSLLIMLMTYIPDCVKRRLMMRPRAEAAAVIITHFSFLFLTMSSIAIAVRGFTKLIDPCSKEVSSFRGRHSPDFTTVYWAQEPRPSFSTAKATFLPIIPQPIMPPPF